MPIFDHFDFLAPIYDRVIRAPGESPLLELLSPPSPGWLLDAGGGTGRVAAALSERFELSQADIAKAVGAKMETDG